MTLKSSYLITLVLLFVALITLPGSTLRISTDVRALMVADTDAHPREAMTDFTKPAALTTREPQTADLSLRFLHIEPRVTSTDLIAHWSFDEGSGYEFRDTSGNNQTGYITGFNWNTTDSGLTSSFRQMGKRAGAAYLNGSQWIEAREVSSPANTSINDYQLTLSAWLKPDGDRKQTSEQTLIAKGREASAGRPANGYSLVVGEARNLRFSMRDRNGTNHQVTTPAATLKPDAWTHVTAVCDAARGTLSIYLDGNLSATTRETTAPFYVAANQANFRIGRASDDGDRRTFKGWIDEVTIYKRALDAAKVRELYLVGLPKLYAQTRETVDADRRIWNTYHGNVAIPHPVESDTIFSLNFNNTLASTSGVLPLEGNEKRASFVPSPFGSALVAANNRITYPSPITSDKGTIELWLTPAIDTADATRHRRKIVFRAEGEEAWLELLSQNGNWAAALGERNRPALTISHEAPRLARDAPTHLAATWRSDGDRTELILYVNGVDVARGTIPTRTRFIFNRRVHVSDDEAESESAFAYLDDLRISNEARSWGAICPRGHVETEASSLDFRDRFDRSASESLMLWRAGEPVNIWRYRETKTTRQNNSSNSSSTFRRSLIQPDARGTHTLFHPDAFGFMAGIEAGVRFDDAPDGWAGVLLNASAPSSQTLDGYTFAVNPKRNELRLTRHRAGRIELVKTLPYDFRFRPLQTYTLNLTLTDDRVLRGYVDGNNLISLRLPEAPTNAGFAGLYTERAAASFDHAHFTALTPSQPASRLIQQRVFSDGRSSGATVTSDLTSINAFRWHKRQGLLPWRYTYKNPQPPGAIFGADDDVERPNPSRAWRAEDSANSSVMSVDGKIYYFMRGNPRANGIHGPAQIGVHTSSQDTFDGIHFQDEQKVLTGHADVAPPACHDGAPGTHRFRQLQINDEGSAYVGAGKILVVMREFRNRVKGYPPFMRLVFGMFDLKRESWDAPVVNTVEWSRQSNPEKCDSVFSGINATPEITALRDPTTDVYTIFLYHGLQGYPGKVLPSAVSVLKYDGANLTLDSSHPTKHVLPQYEDHLYGQRILFDNGIYYMNFNAGTKPQKLRQDWCDLFKLATSLHPYASPWTESNDNANPSRPYFARGAANDFDNAAIWQGAMLKHQGRYYMYYENFHNIENPDQPYENYDHIQAGSRVGFATAD